MTGFTLTSSALLSRFRRRIARVGGRVRKVDVDTYELAFAGSASGQYDLAGLVAQARQMGMMSEHEELSDVGQSRR